MEEFFESGKLASKISCSYEPFVTKVSDVTKEWNLQKFCPKNLAHLLGSNVIKFRIGKRRSHSQDVQWETECEYVECTLQHFLQWIEWGNGRAEEPQSKKKNIENPLLKFPHEEYWCYADYKYMKDLFDQQCNANIKWEDFGFCGKDGNDSTLWLGTKGAFTNCHYDTYGSNLVIQVSGQKRWILFAPSDSENLYPTRIPYEESSVFSCVNILNPNLTKHSRFLNAKPHIVDLKEGDMLFVPPKWWHFVENMKTSVSMNMWIPLESDNETRIQEAMTRYFVGKLLESDDKKHLHKYINPTEDITSVLSTKSNLILLNQSLIRKDLTDAFHCKDRNLPSEKHMLLHIELLKPETISDASNKIKQWTNLKATNESLSSNINHIDILHALTQPDVIQLICNKLRV